MPLLPHDIARILQRYYTHNTTRTHEAGRSPPTAQAPPRPRPASNRPAAGQVPARIRPAAGQSPRRGRAAPSARPSAGWVAHSSMPRASGHRLAGQAWCGDVPSMALPAPRRAEKNARASWALPRRLLRAFFRLRAWPWPSLRDPWGSRPLRRPERGKRRSRGRGRVAGWPAANHAPAPSGLCDSAAGRPLRRPGPARRRLIGVCVLAGQAWYGGGRPLFYQSKPKGTKKNLCGCFLLGNTCNRFFSCPITKM
jgi:hypothetical protein